MKQLFALIAALGILIGALGVSTTVVAQDKDKAAAPADVERGICAGRKERHLKRPGLERPGVSGQGQQRGVVTGERLSEAAAGVTRQAG